VHNIEKATTMVLKLKANKLFDERQCLEIFSLIDLRHDVTLSVLALLERTTQLAGKDSETQELCETLSRTIRRRRGSSSDLHSQERKVPPPLPPRPHPFASPNRALYSIPTSNSSNNINPRGQHQPRSGPLLFPPLPGLPEILENNNWEKKKALIGEREREKEREKRRERGSFSVDYSDQSQEEEKFWVNHRQHFAISLATLLQQYQISRTQALHLNNLFIQHDRVIKTILSLYDDEGDNNDFLESLRVLAEIDQQEPADPVIPPPSSLAYEVASFYPPKSLNTPYSGSRRTQTTQQTQQTQQTTTNHGANYATDEPLGFSNENE